MEVSRQLEALVT